MTCPETAHLELLEYEPDPLGILVQRCSGFGDSNGERCPRTCAARLDRCQRRAGSEIPTEANDDDDECDVRTEVEIVA